MAGAAIIGSTLELPVSFSALQADLWVAINYRTIPFFG